MKRSLWLRRTAAVTALALAVAACGGDDGGDEPTDDGTEEPTDDDGTEEPTDDDGEEPTAEGDGTLQLGYILPESGPLAFLGPPQIEAVNLAVADINAAGGVLGNDVTVSTGDEAGDAAIASENASQLISEGVDAIVGAAASGMSLAFVEAVTSAGILQCSASNTAPTFSGNDYSGLYTRTAPTDALQGPVLAEAIIGDGYQNVAVLARADDYGQGLLDAAVEALEGSGATVVFSETYDPEAQTFSAEVDEVANANPDAVALISFEEGGQILAAMIEAGLGPQDIGVYGADGTAGDDFVAAVGGDESAVEGMRGTRPASESAPDFLTRFTEETGVEDTTYAPQAYDCVMIMALAAELAGSDAGSAIAGEMVNVTSTGGTECGDFAACKEAIDAGEDITYTGASGVVLTETDAGNLEPESGTYEIWTFDAEGNLQSDETVESNF
ncbi:ABC transporter substrate-binding protein [Nitriliruptoraceae bacterium ZYF776]|nr:ABC transporter substrate-binding protein [Profundirhabdus halotolerans]